MKFKPNDIVQCDKHNRLMVVEKYRATERSISKTETDTPVVVTEGGYYNEDDLKLIFRKKYNILEWSEGIVVAAANMLNRGEPAERGKLRKYIDEWSDNIEPILASIENL